MFPWDLGFSHFDFVILQIPIPRASRFFSSYLPFFDSMFSLFFSIFFPPTINVCKRPSFLFSFQSLKSNFAACSSYFFYSSFSSLNSPFFLSPWLLFFFCFVLFRREFVFRPRRRPTSCRSSTSVPKAISLWRLARRNNRSFRNRLFFFVQGLPRPRISHWRPVF